MVRHTATVAFASPLGVIEVGAAPEGVTHLRFAGKGREREVGVGAALAIARAARVEVLAFLSGSLATFTVPVAVAGTPFQRAVWAEIARIPYGESVSYGELAARLGVPRGARAVGAACAANPVPVLVPCHRVVGGNGSLRGFGAGVNVKSWLLDLERSVRARLRERYQGTGAGLDAPTEGASRGKEP
jgi:methylated-DNA-[protein]-cysteine S-methyltransferase